MHYDAAPYYQPDSVIDDVPDERPSPALRPRMSTQELVMQALVDSEWHRRATPFMTACKTPIHTATTPLRRESYVGKLCRQCFTPFEVDELSVVANHKEGSLP
jgi:hypothetical protein